VKAFAVGYLPFGKKWLKGATLDKLERVGLKS
jgi:hypothetical protein